MYFFSTPFLGCDQVWTGGGGAFNALMRPIPPGEIPFYMPFDGRGVSRPGSSPLAKSSMGNTMLEGFWGLGGGLEVELFCAR